MADVPVSVVDASVVAKWHLRDEILRTAALTLLHDLEEDRVRLIAPDIIRFGVPAAINRAYRRGRITFQQAHMNVRIFLQWPIQIVTFPDLPLLALEYAQYHECGFYDACYLALAESTESLLIHADGALVRALNGKFPWIRWLADYQPAPT